MDGYSEDPSTRREGPLAWVSQFAGASSGPALTTPPLMGTESRYLSGPRRPRSASQTQGTGVPWPNGDRTGSSLLPKSTPGHPHAPCTPTGQKLADAGQDGGMQMWVAISTYMRPLVLQGDAGEVKRSGAHYTQSLVKNCFWNPENQILRPVLK